MGLERRSCRQPDKGDLIAFPQTLRDTVVAVRSALSAATLPRRQKRARCDQANDREQQAPHHPLLRAPAAMDARTASALDWVSWLQAWASPGLGMPLEDEHLHD